MGSSSSPLRVLKRRQSECEKQTSLYLIFLLDSEHLRYFTFVQPVFQTLVKSGNVCFDLNTDRHYQKNNPKLTFFVVVGLDQQPA